MRPQRIPRCPPLLFEDEAQGPLPHTTLDYPMWVLPIPTLLSLPALMPHQSLLRQDLLVPWSPEMQGRVIFVSHEWLGHSHPDPANEHLDALKQLLTRLMSGSAAKVESHWLQQVVFQQKVTIDPRRWREALPHMFVWIDYASIPQLAQQWRSPQLDSTTIPAASLGHTVSSSSLCEDSPAAQLTSHLKRDDLVVAHRSCITSVASSDHRFVDDEPETARLMAAAVNSIHGYVERSTLVLVLVPLCEHHDRPDFCNYTSWRSRGWCRMELQAAHLARTDVRVMICYGGQTAPQLLLPVDALQLPAGEGAFTCCLRGHLVNGRRIDCDKDKVLWNVDMMLRRKVEHLAAAGHLVEQRFFTCARRLFLRRRVSPATAFAATVAATDGKETVVAMAPMAQSDGKEALAALKSQLRWREAEDAVLARRTGWSLLQYSVMEGSSNAVAQLLQERADPNQVIRRGDPHFCIFTGMTPLMTAMMHADFGIVDLLLQAGADPESQTRGAAAGLDAFMIGCALGPAENVQRWLVRFPDWPLERVDRIVRMTPLQQAAMIRPFSAPVLRTLLEARASADSVDDLGATLLHSVTSKEDSDWESVLLLMQAGVDVNNQQRPRSIKWRVLTHFARLAQRLGSERHMVAEMARWKGGTALTNAAVHGNMAIINALLDARADASSQNAQGHSALDAACAAFGGEAPSPLQAAFVSIAAAKLEECLKQDKGEAMERMENRSSDMVSTTSSALPTSTQSPHALPLLLRRGCGCHSGRVGSPVSTSSVATRAQSLVEDSRGPQREHPMAVPLEKEACKDEDVIMQAIVAAENSPKVEGRVTTVAKYTWNPRAHRRSSWLLRVLAARGAMAT
mmetsp:Transcript_7948/g.20050  ORF Transcript_7948/g.20050 Transcript_7948/m.20050 type:complete len:853 (-) Transcript_7948:215-2773(-)